MGFVSSRLRAIARQTMDIVERGGYRDVAIAQQVADAVAGTRLYLPADPVAAAETRTATVEVTGESTLQAARRLGGDVAALVFASARNPGGGFLNGAQAQEESPWFEHIIFAVLDKQEPFRRLATR